MNDNDRIARVTRIAPRNARINTEIGPDLVADVIDGHALGDLLDHSSGWADVPAEVPATVVLALWLLVPPDIVMVTWLFAVSSGFLPCGGRLCDTATLFGHPALTLVLSGWSLLSLLVIACCTRGFRRATLPMLVMMGFSALVALVSMLGAFLVLAFLVTVAVLAGLLVLGVVASTADR